MTAATITEISTYDIAGNLKSGTGKRRVRSSIRATTGGTGDTIDLATYITGYAAIESINSQMIDGAVAPATSSNTYATTVLTFAGHGGSGVWIVDVTGTLT